MEIKDIIKTRRLELGFTLKQIADAVGVSEGTVSRWESGDIANMRRDKIYALAQKLGISPITIMGLTPTEETKANRFVELLSTMTDAEQDELMNYMQFLISKRR